MWLEGEEEGGREGGRGRGERATDSKENFRTHTSNPFFLAWIVTFTELESFEMLPLAQTPYQF